MQVDRSGGVGRVRLGDLDDGESFEASGYNDVYIKTDETDEEGILVVDLDSGVIGRWDADEEVIPRAYKVVPA